MSRFLDLKAHLIQASGVLLKVIITNQTRTTKCIQLLFHIIQSAIGGDDRIDTVDQRGAQPAGHQYLPWCHPYRSGASPFLPAGDGCLISGISVAACWMASPV
jgi:hypothetical protein